MSNNALYFLAIIPPGPLRWKFQLLKTEVFENYQSKAALRSPPHITLHMPFRYSEAKEPWLIRSLSEFCSNQKALDLSLDGFGAFPPRVIFVSVESNTDLSSLQRQLGQIMAKQFNVHNANYKEKPFHPHITIAFRDLKKSHFFRAWDHYRIQEFNTGFRAKELTLLKHNGSIWEEHESFKLANILTGKKTDH